jgi:tRNA-specific 2-thiouridylase
LQRNALVAVQGHEHPLLYRRNVEAIDMHWISGQPPALPRRFGAKTRYRMPDAACTLTRTDDGCVAAFDAPQWAPTPGQYLVIYDGDVCLGGGVIAVSQTQASADRVAYALT